jgi:hypothetical protein
MQTILNRFSRMMGDCGRIVIKDSDLKPEPRKIEIVKYIKCIEQMSDPTILETYYITNGNLSTTLDGERCTPGQK